MPNIVCSYLSIHQEKTQGDKYNQAKQQQLKQTLTELFIN
jgi:hypothetical protein